LSRDCTEPRQGGDENAVPKTEKKPKAEGEVAEETDEQAAEDQANAEKEAAKLSLSEWKAQQKNEKVIFNTRQAERDNKALEKFEPLKRDGDKKSGDESYEFEEVEVQSKRAQNTKILDIDVNFANNARGGANFGRREGSDRRSGTATRGGPRQGAAAAGPSGSGRPGGRRLNLNQDFPALG